MEQYPEAFMCPISLEVMEDPYIDMDGNSYEKKAIIAWLNLKHISPITRRQMALNDIVPNRSLKVLIEGHKHNLEAKKSAAATGAVKNEELSLVNNYKWMEWSKEIPEDKMLFLRFALSTLMICWYAGETDLAFRVFAACAIHLAELFLLEKNRTDTPTSGPEFNTNLSIILHHIMSSVEKLAAGTALRRW